MSRLQVLGFDGIVPRVSPTMLGDTFAQEASNVKLTAKELRPWNGPVLDYSPPVSDRQSLFKLYNSAGASAWLMWATPVDVCLSPMADTTDRRAYYTGAGTPKKTNYAMATSGAAPYPTAFLEMGVPAPTGAPAVAAAGGSGTAETRVYVYTYVSTFGLVQEESAPSPASASVNVLPGGTVTVNGFTAPPAGNYNITSRRIYRSVAGSTTTGYVFVAEIPIATASYADSLTALQLGGALGTLGWLPPDPNLQGLVALPGGSFAGFVGNTVYFSEPYYPHAWPLKYALNVPSQIVGLAVMGTSLVVMTERSPLFIHGGVPGAMYIEKIDAVEPCVSKLTIVSDQSGVLYASPNGLMGIGPGGRGIVTKDLYTPDEWRVQTPSAIVAGIFNGRYFGVFPNQSPPRAIVLSRDDIPALSDLPLPARALYVDSKTSEMFYISSADGKVYKLDGDPTNPQSYEWRSKRFFSPRAVSYGFLRLDADYSVIAGNSSQAQIDAIKAANAAIFATGNLKGALDAQAVDVYDLNGSAMKNLPALGSTRTVQVVIKGDGQVVATLQLTSLEPVRLPPFKCRELEFSILGNLYVRAITLATTIAELDGG